MKEVGYQDDRTVEDELEKSEERERGERGREMDGGQCGDRGTSALLQPPVMKRTFLL